MSNAELTCARCNVALRPEKTTFSYLGHDVSVDLPRCPVCGQVFLAEELVRGKMHEVETSLEDK